MCCKGRQSSHGAKWKKNHHMGWIPTIEPDQLAKKTRNEITSNYLEFGWLKMSDHTVAENFICVQSVDGLFYVYFTACEQPSSISPDWLAACMPHSFYVAVHVCAWKVKFTMASFKLESPFHSNEMLVSSYTGKSQGTVSCKYWDTLGNLGPMVLIFPGKWGPGSLYY